MGVACELSQPCWWWCLPFCRLVAKERKPRNRCRQRHTRSKRYATVSPELRRDHLPIGAERYFSPPLPARRCQTNANRTAKCAKRIASGCQLTPLGQRGEVVLLEDVASAAQRRLSARRCCAFSPDRTPNPARPSSTFSPRRLQSCMSRSSARLTSKWISMAARRADTQSGHGPGPPSAHRYDRWVRIYAS
jgi:hypothetical protein